MTQQDYSIDTIAAPAGSLLFGGESPPPSITVNTKDVGELEDALCTSLCGEVSLHLRKDGKISISTPFRFPDGDALLMIAEPTSTGGVRLSDFGHTLMHLSYSMDVEDLIKPGNRNDLFNKILIDHGVGFKHGAIYIETVVTEIGRAVFSLSQALSQIFDISFLSQFAACPPTSTPRPPMNDLSPAAQAVLDAFLNTPGEEPMPGWDYGRDLAAALQAAADAGRRGPDHWQGSLPDDFDKGWEEALDWMARVAAELEGTNAQ